MLKRIAYVLSAVTVTASSVAIGFAFKKKQLEDGSENEIFEDIKKQDSFQDIKVYRKSSFPSNQFINSTIYGKQSLSLNEAISEARDLAYRLKDEVGAPGLVIGVSINGKPVWKEGLGMADVENRVPCHTDTVMRIASISKSMTMAVVARLWQDGKLDLDKPVQEYLPSFPQKKFDKKEVAITTRQLVSHLAGIRHYEKNKESDEKKHVSDKQVKHKKKDRGNIQRDTGYEEFYIKDRFKNVQDSLKLFQDDDLLFKPGTSFAYTTHGWTLVSAVAEAASKEPFTKMMKNFFQVMGLKNTYLDEPEPLIYNRSRYYQKNAKGRLENVPYVDNSYKWAGGGFLSTVGDLLQFGNAMLYSYQWRKTIDNKLYPPGYLQFETMQKMWTPQPGTTMKWGRSDGYGMGWVVVPSLQEYGGGDVQKFAVGHTGGAVGASSVLLILPSNTNISPPPTSDSESSEKSILSDLHNDSGVSVSAETPIPCGVTVAVMINMQDVGLQHLALKVANLFLQTVS